MGAQHSPHVFVVGPPEPRIGAGLRALLWASAASVLFGVLLLGVVLAGLSGFSSTEPPPAITTIVLVSAAGVAVTGAIAVRLGVRGLRRHQERGAGVAAVVIGGPLALLGAGELVSAVLFALT